MKKLQVTIELLYELLGTCNSDPAIHEKFIASKAPDAPSREEEVAALGVDEVVEKGKTVFPKEDGKPFLFNYQIRGFFKAAAAALQRCKGEDFSKATCKIKAYKKVIDGCIFVEPRKIFIQMPEGGEMGDCQRPLRAQTAQGERVALADSESVPAGSRLTFVIDIRNDAYEAAVLEWLAYGRFNGLGQWRNSGKGSFRVVEMEELPDTDNELDCLKKMLKK